MAFHRGGASRRDAPRMLTPVEDARLLLLVEKKKEEGGTQEVGLLCTQDLAYGLGLIGKPDT